MRRLTADTPLNGPPRKIKAEEERKALLKDLYGWRTVCVRTASHVHTEPANAVRRRAICASRPVEPAPEQKPSARMPPAAMRQSLGEKDYKAWKVKHGIVEKGDGRLIAVLARARRPRRIHAPARERHPCAASQSAARQLLLLVVDPETATNIINAFSKMDEAGRKSLDDKFNAMVRWQPAFHLAARDSAMEFRRAVQYLRAKGWTDQELQKR